MFGLDPALGASPEQPLRVVALGAHADDVEIGAGGTLARLADERPHLHVDLVLATGDAARADEARNAAADLLAGAGGWALHAAGLDDGLLPQRMEALRAFARDAVGDARPHLVFAHRLDDAHQDHRAVAELAWQFFRGATIAAYEIPKWDGDLGRMNAYVALGEAHVARKLGVLAGHFPSQAAKPWYDADTFAGLMRVRGVEAGVRHAEAFDCRKLVF